MELTNKEKILFLSSLLLQTEELGIKDGLTDEERQKATDFAMSEFADEEQAETDLIAILPSLIKKVYANLT